MSRKKQRPGRIARNARRKAAGKQKPVKAYIQRALCRLSKKLFGYNIFQPYFDSPRQPKGTVPNPPYNATQPEAEGVEQTPPGAPS